MAMRWDFESERSLTKWVDMDDPEYPKYRAISRCASNTFGSLLYERQAPMGSGYTYWATPSGDSMRKILGNGGTVELIPGSYFEVYLNSRGQNAIDRKYIFQRIVAEMKAKGYHDVAFHLDGTSGGSLWFRTKTYPKAAFETALRALDACLCRNFNVSV